MCVFSAFFDTLSKASRTIIITVALTPINKEFTRGISPKKAYMVAKNVITIAPGKINSRPAINPPRTPFIV